MMNMNDLEKKLLCLLRKYQVLKLTEKWKLKNEKGKVKSNKINY